MRQNQRERLLAAMVAVSAEKGYAALGVADLVELSGVSSRSFYEHFSDKEECFLATMHEILGGVQRMIAGRLGGEGTMEERAQHTAQALTDALVFQPAAARLWLVEAFCAGEQARERVDTALAFMSRLLGRAFDQMPGQANMPAELVQAILGGVAGVVYRRLAEGRADEIPTLTEGLYKWAMAMPAPPQPLRSRARRVRGASAGAPPFVAHAPGERVLRGFTAVVAEKGYAATTIADVSARAAISQNTFYAHFRDKEDALFAALDSSGAQMVAATLPAVRRAPPWPAAMRVAAEALFGFFAAEPDFAWLREVEVYAVGPAAVEQRERTGAEIVAMLGTLALESPPTLDPLAVEATQAALHSLLYQQIRRNGAGKLGAVMPHAVYLALAPQIGAEQAWEIACA